ncbi:MAG: SRPBCC family protein [Omnitrophica WOR_2 bacterium]
MMGDQVTKSIIVKASVEDVYRIWSKFETFPMFMENVESVKMTGGDTSHWKVRGPMGATVEWDAFTTRLDPNQRVAWSTKDADGDATVSGQAVFAPLPDGETQVTVTMHYEPKAGIAGDVVSKMFSHEEERLIQDLRNFKAYCEGMDERTTS